MKISKKKKEKRRRRGTLKKPTPCPNCGQPTHSGHFVPPCFGDPGFWACESFKE